MLGLASRGSPQSASTAPAAVWMPPSRWARKSGSEKDACVWPMPVYQTRPPSNSEHHAIGWSSSVALPSSSAYVDSSTVARTLTPLSRGE